MTVPTDWGDLVYMDFAATSAVRPPSVIQAVARYMTEIGATPGRGGHRLAYEAGRTVLRCRQRVATLLGIPGDPGRIVLTANATLALNAALWGTVRRGDRIVVTAFDHNSVLRPATRLAEERGARIVLVSGSPDGSLDEAALDRALDGARIFSINAASNVLGTTLDVPGLTARARAAGVLTLVDVAQLAGHAPFDAGATDVDMIAFTGHKGMLGPQGVGGLWVRDGIDIEPLITGGTGGNSMLRTMPAALPDHLEAGTLNGPGIAGLIAGIDAVLETGVPATHARVSALTSRLRRGLTDIPDVQVLSPPARSGDRGGVPIVTVVSAVLDAATLATRLDREFGVLTRPGLHCAPEVHRMLGTHRTGAVRFSLGWSSTEEHVDRAVAAVASVTTAAHGRVR